MTLQELLGISPYDDRYASAQEQLLTRLLNSQGGDSSFIIPPSGGPQTPPGFQNPLATSPSTVLDPNLPRSGGPADYWATLLAGGSGAGSTPPSGGTTPPTPPTGGGTTPPSRPTTGPTLPPGFVSPISTFGQVGFGGGANTPTSSFINAAGETILPYITPTQTNQNLIGRNTTPDPSTEIALQNELFSRFPELQYLAFANANSNGGRPSMASIFGDSAIRNNFRSRYGRDLDVRFNNPLFDTPLSGVNSQNYQQIIDALNNIDPRLGRARGPSMSSFTPGTATPPLGVSSPTGGGGTTPPGSGGTGGTGGGGGTNTPPGGGGGAVDPLANLPTLDAQRQRYLEAIDAFVRSQNPYAAITDDLRRQFNLPTQVELQMNQRANPRGNPSNFLNNTLPTGAAFTPGSAPPTGFKWAWIDPDGNQGPHPGNYALTPSQSFFNDLPGSKIEDLQTLVRTLNDPAYQNKLLPSRSFLSSPGVLGDIGNFITTDQSGRNYSLAPQQSIDMLLPFMQNQDLYSYFQDILGTAAPKLGRSFAAAAQNPRQFIFDNINNTSLLSDFFNRTNAQLRRDRLPTIQDLLAGSTGSQVGNENFANAPLDFYRPNTPPPAFFQYLLNDPDGAGTGAPERYMLTPSRNPMMRSEAEQMLATLNNRDLPFGLAIPNNFSTIFSSQLNANNQPVYAINQNYRFPQQDPAGGPTSGAGGPSNIVSGPMVGADPNSYQRGLLEERSGTTPPANPGMVALYGTGFGTANLAQTPAPGSGGTTPPTGGSPTTPTSGAGNPFAGVTPPATTPSRPPAFYTPWSYWT